MRSRLAAISMVAMWLATVPGAVLGQSGAPMPYADYRAAIVTASDASKAASDAAGPLSTVEDAITRFEGVLGRGEAERERLAAVTPEPCYIEAHAAFLAYTSDYLATYRDTLPLISGADSVMGMLPMLLAADATLRAAHPLAYVGDASSMSGFRLEPIHIIDALSTCALVAAPSASPIATTAPPAGSPQPARIVFTDSGNGSKSTAPFELEPGDYQLAYTASSASSVCGLDFALAATDDSYRAAVGGNGAFVYDWSSPYRNVTWFVVQTAGRYYLDVGGDCSWKAELTAAPSPLDGTSQIKFSGTGLGRSPAFTLGGGDYVVRYTLTSPASDEGCSVSARGLIDPASPYSAIGGEIDQKIAATSTVASETHVYGVVPGRYQYEVDVAWCQFGVAEPVAFEITIEPQQ